MGKSRSQAVTSLATLLVCCACSFALDPSLDVSQYSHSLWKIRDGFSTGVIESLVQTPDGYLWVATESGLLRFDGVRAVPWEPPTGQQLPGTNVTNLLTARDGTLWIGTFTGLASWNAGKLTLFSDLRGQNVQSIVEARDGKVWIGTYSDSGGRLCNVQDGVVNCETLAAGVKAIYEDSKGTLWVGQQNGFWRWRPGAAAFLSIPDEPFGITTFAEDEQGHLLFGSHAGIRRIVDGRVEPYLSPGWPYRWQVTRMFRDRDGSLWVGTSEHGVVHIHDGRTDMFSQLEGFSGNYVTRFLEDREGSVWVATFDGLDRFRAYAVPTISAKQGLSNSVAWSVLTSKDGSVWIGTARGLNQSKNGQVSVFGRRGGNEKSDGNLNGRPPVSLFQDSSSRIWISTTAESTGELGYLRNNEFVPIRGFPGGTVHSMAEVPAGHLWVASQQHGLIHVYEGHVLKQIPWIELGRKDWAKVTIADPFHQGLWLGFLEGGVAYYADGKIRASYSSENGLGKGIVTDLRFGSDGGLWAATLSGLSRIKDGRVITLVGKNGLPCDRVVATAEDDDHSMWLYMACGLARIMHDDLAAWIADPSRVIKTTLFDTTDGVRSHAAVGGFAPLMARATDGRIWFLPWDGVSVIDPHHLPFNKIPPPVHIEKITADDNSVDIANGMHLPTGVRHLDIDYTALSLVVPEKVRFRVKLEGEDKDWRELVNVRHVEYTNLPPKHYKFRVLACNNSGVWNQEGASLDFVIPPAWYQTNWFRGACIAAFLMMIWGIHELRVRQLAAQFNMRLEERVAERTRIARDLHDTLLQSFQGLLLLFKAVSYRMQPGEIKKSLDAAIGEASQAITEGRDTVQGLRASIVQERDLAEAIRAFGEELASGAINQSPVAFEVVVEGRRKRKRPFLRDEIYRIAIEALRNAFRHAQADRIEVELQYGDKEFTLRVRDNGRGIDRDVLSSEGRKGHFGLHGMRERAKLAGGELAIWSEVDSGTEIELTIPASRAYTMPARGFSWFRRLSHKKTDVKEKVES